MKQLLHPNYTKKDQALTLNLSSVCEFMNNNLQNTLSYILIMYVFVYINVLFVIILV